MSSPVQSLHLQTSMLVFRYLPAPRAFWRVLDTLFWPVAKIKKLYVRRRTAPPRQLKVRRRAHSLSLPAAGSVERPAFQASSELLTKLPFELRQLIWKECLGGMTLHLKIANRRLLSRFCTEDLQSDPCWEFFGLQVKGKDRERPKKRQILSILLACRQTYSEAKEYLYSENVFDTLFFESVLYLPRVILPQRLASIRSLYFLWYLEEPPIAKKHPREHLHLRYDKDVWATMWQNLAMMTGLTDLGIQLYIDPSYHSSWSALELQLLQEVKPITAPRKFDLYLPFPSTAKKSELAKFPCRIIRTPEIGSYH